MSIYMPNIGSTLDNNNNSGSVPNHQHRSEDRKLEGMLDFPKFILNTTVY